MPMNPSKPAPSEPLELAPLKPLELAPLPIVHLNIFVEIIEHIFNAKKSFLIKNKKTEKLEKTEELSNILKLEKAITHFIKKEYEEGRSALLKLRRHYENKITNFSEYLWIAFNNNDELKRTLLEKVYRKAIKLMNPVHVPLHRYIHPRTRRFYTPYHSAINTPILTTPVSQVSAISPAAQSQQDNFDVMFQTERSQAHANAILERIGNEIWDRRTLIDLITKERELSDDSVSRYCRQLSTLNLMRSAENIFTLTDQGKNHVESIPTEKKLFGYLGCK